MNSTNNIGYTADLKSYYNYYAFGMLQAGRHYTFADEYNFGFNGKENDNDWNGNPAIFRFTKFISIKKPNQKTRT